MTITEMAPLFQVFDVRSSVAFYEQLGFEVTGTYEPDGHLYWAELRLAGIILMLNAKYEDDARPGEPDSPAMKAHADTELYFRCDDVETAREELIEAGVDVPEIREQHGRREFVLVDPDGFRLSFYR